MDFFEHLVRLNPLLNDHGPYPNILSQFCVPLYPYILVLVYIYIYLYPHLSIVSSIYLWCSYLIFRPKILNKTMHHFSTNFNRETQ